MECTPPFELKDLRRDWIAGVSGGAFVARVKRRIVAIKATSDACERGVMIAEKDPVRFASAFFAAVYLGVPVILANRRWGLREWEEVSTVMNPALICGATPLSTEARAAVKTLLENSIYIATGGSSGGVKFARHEWSTLAAAWVGLRRFMGPGPYHACCVLPLFHVSGLMQLVRAFLSRGQIAFPDFQDLQAGDFPEFESGTLCLSLVPTQLQRLMTQQRICEQLQNCRVIFIGGAPLPDSVAEQARELRLPLVLSYGMTETAAMVAVLSPDEFLAGQTNAGRPLNHAQIDIMCGDDFVCEVGKVGRIRINSSALFSSYRGSLGGGLSEDGYWTDDEGFFDSLGRLHIVGRTDRLIISGGEKIDPREVEEAIRQTGAVEDVLAIGWPDPEWGQQLVAFYTTAGVDSDARKWEEEIRADLANYKLPKLMIHVPLLPLNERGKVDHKWIERLINQTLRLEG
ncbi:MAG: AMP-binding protein [Coraliomargarita sp.]